MRRVFCETLDTSLQLEDKVQRIKVWQRGKVLILVGAIFFGVAFLITAVVGLSSATGYGSWLWAGYFLAATAGLVAILRHHGWYRRPQDRIRQERTWMLARTFFRIQTIVVGIFGGLMILLPELALDPGSGFWPWRVEIRTLQTFGALFLATCIATGWASLQTEKARIRALLPLDAVFPALALLAVGFHWDVIASESPRAAVTGVWVFLYSFVAAVSTYLFFSSRKGTE